MDDDCLCICYLENNEMFQIWINQPESVQMRLYKEDFLKTAWAGLSMGFEKLLHLALGQKLLFPEKMVGILVNHQQIKDFKI